MIHFNGSPDVLWPFDRPGVASFKLREPNNLVSSQMLEWLEPNSNLYSGIQGCATSETLCHPINHYIGASSIALVHRHCSIGDVDISNGRKWTVVS